MTEQVHDRDCVHDGEPHAGGCFEPATEAPQRLDATVPVRFPPELAGAAKRLAEREGMSVSAWIRREVDREVARRSGRCPACGAKHEPAGETGARADPPPPVAADLEVAALQTSAGCARLDRMVTEYGDAIGAVRQAVDLLGARIHSAEDARIIADARDALRVLEGAEAHPEPSGTLAPAPASPERAAAATGPARAKDGSEGGRVTRLCPTCLHDGVLERTLDRAAAAEARLAGIAAMARDAKVSAPSGMTAIVAAERVLAAAGGDGETPRPWTAADERRRILAIADRLRTEFEVTATNAEGTRTVTIEAVPYVALRSMVTDGGGPGQEAAVARLRELGVIGGGEKEARDA